MTSYRPLADNDPFPGEPGGLRSYRSHLVERADAVSRLAETLRAVDDGLGSTWSGEGAATFRTMAESGRRFSLTTSQSLHSVADVMGQHADALEQAQRNGKSIANEAASCENTIHAVQQRLTNTSCTDPSWPSLQQQLADATGRLSSLRRSFHDVRSAYDDAVRQAQSALQSTSSRSNFAGLPFDNPIYQQGTHWTLTIRPSMPAKKPSKGKQVGKAASKAPRKVVAAPAKHGTGSAYGRTQVVTSQRTVGKIAQSTAGVNKQGRNFGGAAQATAFAGAKGTFTSGADKNGANIGVTLEVVAAASLSADGSFHSTYVNAEAEVHATVEAKATFDSVASIGPDGAAASVGVAAFAGGELGTSGHIDVGGVGVGGDAGITYGIGGSAKLDAKITKEKVSISGDLGATLGLGVHTTFQIDLHPTEMVHSISNLLHL